VTDSPLQPPLDAVIEALDGLGLRYAVVGGLAVSAWGAPRATKDVDLYAELVSDMRPALRRELVARDFDVPAMEEELQRLCTSAMAGTCSRVSVHREPQSLLLSSLTRSSTRRRRRAPADREPLVVVEDLAALRRGR
jgi:hypothetical protein